MPVEKNLEWMEKLVFGMGDEVLSFDTSLATRTQAIHVTNKLLFVFSLSPSYPRAVTWEYLHQLFLILIASHVDNVSDSAVRYSNSVEVQELFLQINSKSFERHLIGQAILLFWVQFI